MDLLQHSSYEPLEKITAKSVEIKHEWQEDIPNPQRNDCVQSIALGIYFGCVPHSKPPSKQLYEKCINIIKDFAIKVEGDLFETLPFKFHYEMMLHQKRNEITEILGKNREQLKSINRNTEEFDVAVNKIIAEINSNVTTYSTQPDLAEVFNRKFGAGSVTIFKSNK